MIYQAELAVRAGETVVELEALGLLV